MKMRVCVTNAMSVHMLVLISNRDAASEKELDASTVLDTVVEINARR